MQNVRFALRGFFRSPAFTTVAVLSLALGIGANTAIFSLIDELILKPLPVRDSKTLVLLRGVGRHYGSNNGINALAYPMYQDIRDKNSVFDGMMCRYALNFSVGVLSQNEVVSGELVSGNYFPLLGVGPAIGRVFSASDDLHEGDHPYAVLSYAWWQSRFAGDPTVIGRTIHVNNYPLTIIGVSRKGFDGMEPGLPARIFVPMMMTKSVRPGFTALFNRRSRWVNVYGRLKPGFDIQRAKAGLQPLFHRIIGMEVLQPAFRNASPFAREQFLRMSLDVLPGSQGNTQLRRKYEKPLWLLMGVVALVLSIACANLAGLLTARAAARQKEIAVRLAIGSGRARLIRQLLTESLILAAAGGVAGIGLAVVMIRALLAFLPVTVTGYNITAAPDPAMLAFTGVVSLAAGVAFGLMPALQATRPDIAPVLKDQAAAVGGGAQAGFRKVLVAGQVTLSLVLLIGAGVFLRSLGNLRDLNPGFRTGGVIVFQLNPRGIGYDPGRTAAFFRQLEVRLNNTPGIQSASFSEMAMLTGNEWDMWVAIEGRPHAGEVPDPHFNAVTPRYFDTIGMRILNGRAFTIKDDQGAPKVAIVNSRFARKYFPEANPVGRHIGIGGDPDTKTDIEIAGVVNDARYESLRNDIPEEVYLPEWQRQPYGETVYVHTGRDTASAFKAIRAVVHDLDPGLPVVNLKTLDRQLDESLVSERLTATLCTVFGLLATGLVLIGLYGVVSFAITRRSREIGIRMALGAKRGHVVWLVLREALLLVTGGIAVGLPAAYALTRIVRSQLYGIEPGDPASIVAAAILLAAVTAAAGFIPARRAASFNPVKILRYE